VAASVLLLGLATVFVPELGVAQQIWGKHTEQIMKGDVFSKRDEIWEKTLDDMRLWGNGSTYFSESVGISSHNSIMHIIGENGPVAALLMILFAGIAAAIALRQAFIRRRRKVFDALPALIATCFWTMSAGEAMFGSLGTGITLAYLLSVGIAINGAALAPGGRASGR
jgi:hypothetical protein